MSTSLNVNVGNVNLKSPIILASGTCNFGRELAEYYDLNILGEHRRYGIWHYDY